MDLLAIINTSYKLTVYRSTWVEDKFVLQKIWAINSTLCQTSIEWRPDGKQFFKYFTISIIIFNYYFNYALNLELYNNKFFT